MHAQLNWQLIAALLCVGLAVAFLGVRACRTLRALWSAGPLRSECGHCPLAYGDRCCSPPERSARDGSPETTEEAPASRAEDQTSFSA